MASVPKSVRIFGREYSIKVEPLEDVVGLCYEAEQRISIAPDQTPIEEADTVLHETLHGLDYVLGMGLTEEQVRGTASGLIGILKDNPKFLRYLASQLKEPKAS